MEPNGVELVAAKTRPLPGAQVAELPGAPDLHTPEEMLRVEELSSGDLLVAYPEGTMRRFADHQDVVALFR